MKKLIVLMLVVVLLLVTVSPALAGPTENTSSPDGVVFVTIPDEAKVVGMPTSFDGRSTANGAIPGP